MCIRNSRKILPFVAVQNKNNLLNRRIDFQQIERNHFIVPLVIASTIARQFVAAVPNCPIEREQLTVINGVHAPILRVEQRHTTV